MRTTLATELTILGWSVVLLLVQIGIQSVTRTHELGTAWNVGARDGAVPPPGVLAGRAERALRNFLETYPAFVGLALALTVSGKAGGLATAGAHLWFWARLAYLPLYLAGVPVLRSLAWSLALAGLVMMVAALLV